MSKSINDVLDKSDEIELSVAGRISGEEIPRPVWFVNEDGLLYLLPVQGSNTNSYKNLQKNPHVKISISGHNSPNRVSSCRVVGVTEICCCDFDNDI